MTAAPTVDGRVAGQVALLGLGAMGWPMCTRLLGGCDVVAYDPDPERLRMAVEAGAEAARSPAEAATGASAVVVAVRDEVQLLDAMFGHAGVARSAASGTIVIVTSTVGPAAVRSVDRRLATTGAELVDAPVSGGPARAERGELVAMVGCPEERMSRCRPLLELIADQLHHVGGAVGDGQALKVVNQLLAGVHIAAAAEALALAAQMGLDTAIALGVLGAGAGASFMLADRGPRMLETSAQVRSELDIFVKDMGLVLELARENKVSTALAATAEQLYVLASRLGLGPEDDSALFKLLSTDGHGSNGGPRRVATQQAGGHA